MTRIFGCTVATCLISIVWFPTTTAADSFDLALLSGKTITVGDERQKPIYLKFWASWCGQCLAQMPHLEAIHKNHGANIDVVAVNFGLNDSLELIGQVQRKYEMTVPIAYDELGEISRSFDVAVVPYSIIIDREGKTVHRKWGDEGVDEKIAELIQDRS